MQDEMLPFVQSFLSPFLRGFREGNGTQHALLRFVEGDNGQQGHRGGCLD